MKIFKKSIRAAWIVALTLFTMLGVLKLNEYRAEAKTVEGLKSCIMYSAGDKIYYCDPSDGAIKRLDISTGDISTIAKNPGPVYGFTSLVVKDKYIYAEADLAEGSYSPVTGSRLYRISLDGKKKKVLIDKFWGGFTVTDSRIYYNEIKGGNNFDGKKGAAKSIKLNGKSKKSAKKVTVNASKDSASSKGQYGSDPINVSSDGHWFTVTKDHDKIYGDEVLIYSTADDEDIASKDRASEYEGIHMIAAHKQHFMALVSYRNREGYSYEKLIYSSTDPEEEFIHTLVRYLPGD